MESALDGLPRTYVIKRSQHLGYGFMAGYESPTMVKIVEPNGPSYKRLLPGDVIMAVNGVNVENAPREQIIKMIQLNDEQIEIQVRQPTYEELIRAKNLTDPKFYTLNRPNNVGSLNNRFPPNISPLNRLVTSISQQQHQQHSPNSPSSINAPFVASSQQANQFSKNILKQQSSFGTNQDKVNNNERVVGRITSNFGRHSPIPQRCKSSIDQNCYSNKKAGDEDNDQPLLKRSNTMRPIKLPSKVKEIFEVVIKIFFEVGHTRVLNYNQGTTVGTILETLNARLVGNSEYSEQIKQYFGLAVTIGVNAESEFCGQLLKRKMLHVLDENYLIMKIRELPYAPKLRLLYRMVYPPADVNTLYSQDKIAFEYLYQQSCNDLKLERFTPGLDEETALKLSALHLLEYVYSNMSKAHGNTRDPKVYMNLIKKTPGIQHFIPVSIADNMVDKKGRKVSAQYKKIRNRLTEHLKRNFEEFDFELPKVRSTTNLNNYSTTSYHELSLPQTSPSDYVKLLFLNYLSQLPCYGNFKRPQRISTSPVERTSAGDCSSSLESVPRTSDSSPLIRQDRNPTNPTNNSRAENLNSQNISRLAQMNSMRSLCSAQSSSISQPIDQPDMAQTPSIESISSITFNMQNSPSPQHPLTYLPQPDESFSATKTAKTIVEPSPKPREHKHVPKTREYNSIEKLYSQRYVFNERPIEELLKNAILLPPPPPPLTSVDFNALPYQIVNRRIDIRSASQLTRILSDRDLEKLRVPPPPRMMN